jgi:Tfp pilus assembly protein PilF
VVVDTGSTDQTVAIAREHGAEIHPFAWCDDFSAARNAALQHATGDWVLSLDADEELPLEQHDALRRLLAQDAVMGWRLPLVDVGREKEGQSYVPRLFRNAPGLHFVGRVHEQVFYSVEARRVEWGLENRLGDAVLRHHGYTPEIIQERGKVARNLRLLELAIDEMADDPLVRMNYGLELVRSARMNDGLHQYRIAFDLMAQKPAAAVVPETREALLTQYSAYLRQAKRPAEALQVLSSPLARTGELTASQYFIMGLAELESQQFTAAAKHMRQCLAKRHQPALTPVNPEIHTVIPRHSIALCLWQSKDAAGAESEFRAAIAEAPDAARLHVDFANFLHEHGQTAEALQMLNTFTTQHPAAVTAWACGGQIALSHPALLEVATDWTAVALSHHPAEPALKAQRAEVLLLAAKLPEALALWNELAVDTNPRFAAARILCAAALAQLPPAPPIAFSPAVNQEFVRWYWKLVEFGAEATVLQLHASVDALRSALPGAAEVLRSVIEKLAVAEVA